MEVVPLQFASTLQNIREKPLGFFSHSLQALHKFIIGFNGLLENTMVEILW